MSYNIHYVKQPHSYRADEFDKRFIKFLKYGIVSEKDYIATRDYYASLPQ